MWPLVVYRILREPTRLRATVWRRIKALGAVYLRSSVAALPDSPPNERALRSLRREIVNLGEAAQVLRSQMLAGSSNVSRIYNAARDEEYAEIVDRCRDFRPSTDSRPRWPRALTYSGVCIRS